MGYIIGNVIGNFLVMLIFMIIAIATAKKKSAWTWYILGAVVQLISLLGRQKQANMFGIGTSFYWKTFCAILIIAAVIVGIRYNIANSATDAIESKEENNLNKGELCKNCGSKLSFGAKFCTKCGMKIS